jgi:hypothetical protein
MTRTSIDGGNRPRVATCLSFLALALALALLQPAPVHAQAAATANPRLASLGIEIWPEYDRPAALVILRGTLAEDAKLPAAVTLRLPGTSGGAAAVAYSTTADGSLLNMKHERATTGEFVTVKFETPTRFFHVEFYEPIPTTSAARSYRYVWQGDLAAARIMLVVQEPATATDMAVEPNLDRTQTGQEGLRYRTGELPAQEPGKPLAIAVRYTKTDARPTAEILKPTTSASAAAAAPANPAASASPAAAPAALPGADRGGWPVWAAPLAAFVLLGLLGAAFVLWRWSRESRGEPPTQRVCAKCGAAQAPGNKFCGNCGTKVR